MNRNRLIPQLAKAFLTQSCQYWLKRLHQAGVPCGPVNNIEQALDEPQVEHRNMLFEMVDHNKQKVPQIANPLKFSAIGLSYEIPPPVLGDSTKEVLSKELKLTEAEIAELEAKGVIG